MRTDSINLFVNRKDITRIFLTFLGFIRSKLPYDLITHLDQTNVDIFLNSWWDNRIRVIIFGSTPLIRLRYLLLAFQYRERAAFGLVIIENINCKKLDTRALALC